MNEAIVFPFFFIASPLVLLVFNPSIPSPHSLLTSHSHYIAIHAVLPYQYRSSSSPSTSTPCAFALSVIHTPSIVFTCPTHFSRLLTSFLAKLSITPTSSFNFPPFFECRFFSHLHFFSLNYSHKLAVPLVVFLSAPLSLGRMGTLVLCMSQENFLLAFEICIYIPSPISLSSMHSPQFVFSCECPSPCRRPRKQLLPCITSCLFRSVSSQSV